MGSKLADLQREYAALLREREHLIKQRNTAIELCQHLSEFAVPLPGSDPISQASSKRQTLKEAKAAKKKQKKQEKRNKERSTSITSSSSSTATSTATSATTLQSTAGGAGSLLSALRANSALSPMATPFVPKSLQSLPDLDLQQPPASFAGHNSSQTPSKDASQPALFADSDGTQRAHTASLFSSGLTPRAKEGKTGAQHDAEREDHEKTAESFNTLSYWRTSGGYMDLSDDEDSKEDRAVDMADPALPAAGAHEATATEAVSISAPAVATVADDAAGKDEEVSTGYNTLSFWRESADYLLDDLPDDVQAEEGASNRMEIGVKIGGSEPSASEIASEASKGSKHPLSRAPRKSVTLRAHAPEFVSESPNLSALMSPMIGAFSPMKQIPCKFYAEGKCYSGPACRFLHLNLSPGLGPTGGEVYDQMLAALNTFSLDGPGPATTKKKDSKSAAKAAKEAKEGFTKCAKMGDKLAGNKKKREEAIQAYTQALMFQEDLTVLYKRAILFRQEATYLGRSKFPALKIRADSLQKRAQQDFSTIVSDSKDSSLVSGSHLFRGEAFLAKELYELALPELDKHLKISKGDKKLSTDGLVGYHLRGEAHLALGHLGRALADFKSALKRDSGNKDLYTARINEVKKLVLARDGKEDKPKSKKGKKKKGKK